MPLSELLQRAGLKPQARYIVFHCADTMEGGEADSAGDGESDDAAGLEQANPNMTKRSGSAEDKRDTNEPSDADDDPPKRTSLSSEPVRYYESIDLVDAYHPQTILAYTMNGQPLPVAHGAPLRLRLERQLGYKQAKYVMHIEVVESYAAIGQGRGGYWRIKATPGTPASEKNRGCPKDMVLRDPVARATGSDLESVTDPA